MDCPRCKEKMEVTNSSGVETATCLYCNGTWVNHESLNTLLEKETSSAIKTEVQNAFKSHDNKLSDRKCSNCENEKLYKITINKIALDACIVCGGVFFDEGKIKGILPTTHEPDKSYYGGVNIMFFDSCGGDGGGGGE